MRALITGITGQDGSYLAEFLLAKGYEVHGVIRRSSTFGTGRIDHIYDRLKLHYGDVTDGSAMSKIIRTVAPTEVYNLAAQSHVRVSFDQPVYTADATAIGALKVLEAVREAQDACGHEIRLYQASSSEMFGNEPPPQSERTPFRPRSPYAVSKLFAHTMAVNYREAHGLWVRCGILFNHESPRRGETFVTRKITRAATRIKVGLQRHLHLGNLAAARDWGFAGDYVEAMWMMLQNYNGLGPQDLVIGTGKIHTVRDFCARAFGLLGLDYIDHVLYDERYCRPSEVYSLSGCADAAREELGWSPRTSFEDLVGMMVASDLRLAEKETAMASC